MVYFGFQCHDGSGNETKAAFRQNYVSSLACVTVLNKTGSAKHEVQQLLPYIMRL